MSLIHLRTFVEVYRHRSISEAARVLALTQPAVSQHIASLETQLARPLFERHSRGVRPTVIADDLAASIGQSLDQAEAALASVRARSGRLLGTVHIAAPSDYLSDFVAARLGPLIDAGLDLRLHIGGRDSLYDQLLADTVHLGLTASKPDDPRLASMAVGVEKLRAVAAPQVADRISELGLATGLGEIPHLAYDLDKPLIRTWLAENGLVLDRLPTATAPDLRVLRAMLSAGIGWSVLPGYLTRAERSAGALVEIPPPVVVPQNQFFMVWARTALRHPRVAFARDALADALTLNDVTISAAEESRL